MDLDYGLGMERFKVDWVVVVHVFHQVAESRVKVFTENTSEFTVTVLFRAVFAVWEVEEVVKCFVIDLLGGH